MNAYHVSRQDFPVGFRLEATYGQNLEQRLHLMKLAFARGDQFVEELIFIERFNRTGSTVAPGLNGLTNLVIELEFESVRRSDYPDKPSRLESVYLSPDEASARTFMAEYRTDGHLFTCEVEGGNHHAGDFYLVTKGINLENPFVDELVAIRERAALYWSGTVQEGPTELLVAGGEISVASACLTG